MSSIKRAVKAVTTGGASELQRKQEKEARRKQEEAARQAEEAARLQAQQEAELEAAQAAASQAIPLANEQSLEVGQDLASKKKKKLKGGKQSLSIARSSGSGINI